MAVAYATLDDLRAECLTCSRCNLRSGCRQVVFGEGNPQARLMLVGEAPGAQEDIEGRPFVGAAGQLLDRILAAAGLSRKEVFIGNVIKCRPPGNRFPNAEEVAQCRPYLEAQIQLIRPRLILCMGNLALKTLINPYGQITKDRGKWVDKGEVKLMATFHPAALLRDPSKKKLVWEDFQKVRDAYRAGMAEQLSLFG